MQHADQQQATKADKELAQQAPVAVPAEVIEQAWFEAAANPPKSVPPVPVEKLGGFLGDPLADHWLR